MLFTFLLVLHAIIAAALVTVILMQRSEGGGMGMGGSPSGLMSARGAADFLTRSTTVLATLFVVMSIVLAVLASTIHSGGRIDASRQAAPPVSAPVPTAPGGASDSPFGDNLAGAVVNTSGTAPANRQTPAGVPFQH